MVSAIKVNIKWPFVEMLADPKLLRPIGTSSWRKRIMFHGRKKIGFVFQGGKIAANWLQQVLHLLAARWFYLQCVNAKCTAMITLAVQMYATQPAHQKKTAAQVSRVAEVSWICTNKSLNKTDWRVTWTNWAVEWQNTRQGTSGKRVKPTKTSGKYKAAQMARRRWRLAHLQRLVTVSKRVRGDKLQCRDSVPRPEHL